MILSSLFGPSAQTMRRYEEDLAEWRAVCDDMDLAEAQALEKFTPGPCELCQYWGQQCVGLCIEVPCRLMYHTTCMASAFACCLNAPPGGLVPECLACDPDRAIWRHHAMTIQEYWWLSRLLAENLCIRPCTPWYVYSAEVGLIRPPKPTPPKGCCDDCCGPQDGNDCCACDLDCSCERLLYHVNRRLRSLLCSYAGVDACHPSQCFGPCPWCIWQGGAADNRMAEPAQPTKKRRTRLVPTSEGWMKLDESTHGHSAPASCCACAWPTLPVFESQTARHLRWDQECEHARQARTAAFYERWDAVARGEPLTGGERAYVNFEVPTGDVAAIEVEADAHRCERLQGRLAALAMLGCCCVTVAAGCGQLSHLVPVAAV